MNLALSIARRYKGLTHPNPTVGCVIVKRGRIIGLGFHEGAGKPHAEIIALRMAGREAKDSDMYVTLEPCSHHGRTPPCTEAIVRAGIRRVFVGVRDPNPLVDGIEYLRSKNIYVKEGILKEECFSLNMDFFTFVLKGRPYITLKIAQSMDGSIATHKGYSKWITSYESRRYVHRLRSYASAILVGANTVIKDNPKLTVRYVDTKKQPLRIIIDPSFKTNPDFQVFNTEEAETLLVVSKPDVNREKEFMEREVEVIHIPLEGNFINLKDLLKILASRGIINVMVEGGIFTFRKFIEKNMFDRIILFSAPKFIGGMHLKSEIVSSTEEAINMRIKEVKRIGEDILVELLNKKHITSDQLI